MLKADHGFNVESRAIHDLIDVMASYDAPTRREYLQFITGSPKLPIGGEYQRHQLYYSVYIVRRFPWPEPTFDCGAQASRGSSYSRRLSSKCHDLCQLSQTARVQLEGNHARETADCDEGGCWQLPFVLIVCHSLIPWTCIYNFALPCAFTAMSIRMQNIFHFRLQIGAY